MNKAYVSELVINIVRFLCPELKKLAAKSDNKLDDVAVHLLCKLVNGELEP